MRAFLAALAENEAVCTVQFGDLAVGFDDVDQVRAGVERLSQDNLHEERQLLYGELQGVLPDRRLFEFRVTDPYQIIHGRIAQTIAGPDALNRAIHKPMAITVMVTRVGKGRPRHLLLETHSRS